MKSPLLPILLSLLALLLVMPAQAQDDAPAAPTWDGQSRFTVLVMGIDRRPGDGETLLVRTDAMILVSIDPLSQSVGMLHIPRDVHMAPPQSENYVRINTLFQDGETLQEGYGPYWVMDTFEYNLGLYVDRYVMFDFDAFIALIDAIGGIEITIDYSIRDDAFPDMDYGYDPFVLAPGTHQLNGYEALQFARTRHQDGDEMRGLRQLQVIDAVRERISDPLVFRDLLANADSLLDSLQNDVYTDLSFDEMVLLARYALLVPPENIISATMDDSYTQRIYNSLGQRVRIPDSSTIVELLSRVFGADYAG